MTSISESFYTCTELKEFIVSEQNQNFSSIDGVLFNKDKTALILFPVGKSGAYNVPNSVTSIKGIAFLGCIGLTSVTIPNSVTSIGSSAFLGCTGLTEIYSKNPTPPSIVGNAFSVVTEQTCKLYVPKGSYAAYWLQWGFDNIIEMDYTVINPINAGNKIIKSVANGIAIETKETTPISIYNLSGQIVYQSAIQGNEEIPLNKGVYIVNINNESEKLIVK